jgi:hypothetical protein
LAQEARVSENPLALSLILAVFALAAELDPEAARPTMSAVLLSHELQPPAC